MIILPATTTEAGLERAETLRLAVTALRLEHATSPIASVVTVSVGVARYTPRKGIDSEALIVAVDMALYSAKQAGRNCVRLDSAATVVSDSVLRDTGVSMSALGERGHLG